MNAAALVFRPRPAQNLSGEHVVSQTRDSRSHIQCQFFMRGLCRNGDACPYLHQRNGDGGGDSDKVVSVASIAADSSQPAVEEKLTRIVSGAMVYFEAGAAITNVSFSSDFSAVQLVGLPPDSTPSSVFKLLHSCKIDTAMIRPIRIIHGDHQCSARLEAEDAGFAASVTAKLNAPATSQKQSSTVNAIPVTVEAFSVPDGSVLRVDCNKIHCSWHKPVKTLWLEFGDEVIAKRVSQKFKQGSYKILGQAVDANEPMQGRNRFRQNIWTVRLTEVPATATTKDISRVLQQRDKPHDIQIGKPTYRVDIETCSAQVQSLFTAIGPLEWWEFTPDTTGKRMKASARFLHEEDAKTAVTVLNNAPLPFNNTARLTCHLVYSARFKVSSIVYDAVESLIKARIQAWKSQHLHFVAYPQPLPPKWNRVLKIEGEDAKSVAEAKKVISDIFAGTVAMDGTSPLWHPSLRGKGPLLEKLTQIQEQTGVVILRNKAKSQIRLFGPPKKFAHVQLAIREAFKVERSKEFTIDLDEEQFLWAFHGGFKRLVDALGPTIVSLNIVPTPKQIMVAGSASQYHAALALIGGEAPQDAESDANGHDCSVCWSEAENPVRTTCDHVYCLDCFDNLCLSVTTQDKEVKVRCVGGHSGRCGAVLALPELQDHLSSTAFEELLQQAFASYTRLHPERLKYCPSPDCDHVYRVSDVGKMQTCRGCLVPVCTRCHAQHESMSCAEYRDISSGGHEANERLKKEMGIKDCPKCKTPLEKTEGCNHMTCRCGAHICWVCLDVFPSSGGCYTHMTDKHGGIGLEHYQHVFGR